MFDVAQGGPVLVAFEARCAWSDRRSRRGASALALPWWAFARAGGEV